MNAAAPSMTPECGTGAENRDYSRTSLGLRNLLSFFLLRFKPSHAKPMDPARGVVAHDEAEFISDSF